MPANLDDFWAGFNPRTEALETEVLKEWERDGVVGRLVRYQVGTFQGRAQAAADPAAWGRRAYYI